VSWLWELFEGNAYAVVAASVFAQNVGVPMPAQVALLGAAYLCFRGQLWLPGLIGLAAAAAFAGALLGYGIGRRWGHALLTRFVAPARVARLEGFFRRHGGLAVLAGRFVAASRTLGALVAGLGALPLPRFALASAAGALLWSGAVVGGGYALGESFQRIDDWLGWISLAVGGAFVIGLLVWWGYRRRSST